MESFLEVADAFGMKGPRREQFCKYMFARWGRDEALQCRSGYAGIVANSFMQGKEFTDADSWGKEILQQIWRGQL